METLDQAKPEVLCEELVKKLKEIESLDDDGKRAITSNYIEI
jgi:hypothetical protein